MRCMEACATYKTGSEFRKQSRANAGIARTRPNGRTGPWRGPPPRPQHTNRERIERAHGGPRRGGTRTLARKVGHDPARRGPHLPAPLPHSPPLLEAFPIAQQKSPSATTGLLKQRIETTLRVVSIPYGLGRVPQNRDKVTHGARDNEQVPHKVKVPDSFRHKEHRTCRVSDTACK